MWSGDGRELFYYTESGALMAVPVSTSPGFSAGAPSMLFQLAISRYSWEPCDVSPDGQRFIVAGPIEADTPPVIRVVQNWYAEFRDWQNEERP